MYLFYIRVVLGFWFVGFCCFFGFVFFSIKGVEGQKKREEEIQEIKNKDLNPSLPFPG